jgi:hypothetical protein
MALLLVPVLFALVGVLMYALSANPKLCEIGRIMFWSGLIVALWAVAGERVRVM